MLMETPSFVQAVSISYESMTFNEALNLPSTQRIALLRIREIIKDHLDKQSK